MLRVGLAICAIMLALALLDWPYGYYQMLRIVTTGVLVWLLFSIWDAAHIIERAGLALLAISYNPILKISMERETHAIINIATIIVLAYVYWRHRPSIDAV